MFIRVYLYCRRTWASAPKPMYEWLLVKRLWSPCAARQACQYHIISGQYDRLLPGPMLSISVHCALQVRTFGRGRIICRIGKKTGTEEEKPLNTPNELRLLIKSNTTYGHFFPTKIRFFRFYRQHTDARHWYSILFVCLSVCPSVCPSRSGIRWKRLNILSQCFLPYYVAQSL